MTVADPSAKTVYLENRGLGGENDYSIAITSDGVVVYSECCCDTMSVDTARAVHQALGRYLADLDGAEAR